MDTQHNPSDINIKISNEIENKTKQQQRWISEKILANGMFLISQTFKV